MSNFDYAIAGDYLDRFQKAVGDWGNETFEKSTSKSVIAHLKREVFELAESMEPEEAADCFLLLLHFAHKSGFSLFDEATKKFGVIQMRKWGLPDHEGVCEHIKEANP